MLRKNAFKEARVAYEMIDSASVYHPDAKDRWRWSAGSYITKNLGGLTGNCPAYEEKLAKFEDELGKEIVDIIRAENACVLGAIVKCDPKAERIGMTSLDNRSFGAALVQFERALACKPEDAGLLMKAMNAACQAKNTNKAKLLLARIADDQRTAAYELCAKAGVTLDDAGNKAE